MEHRIELEMSPQPDDSTCGPTALHALYRYYGDAMPLAQLVEEVEPLETGGTLAVHLACHALRRGYRATIYVYNLLLFDPTWFEPSAVDLAAKLRAQAEVKAKPKLRHATKAYLEFLALGGRVRFEDLTPALLRRHLRRGTPILTGLNATYLYHCAREVGTHDLAYDDVRGLAQGHFVVLTGWDGERREVLVADPLHENPFTGSPIYPVPIDRLIGAIFLGVLTYDANLTILEPAGHRPRPEG